jgi:ABC-type glycerol-3-phosphate transport system permease component
VRWEHFARAAELVAPFVVNSIIVSAAVTVLALLVASMAAYAFARIPFRGRGAAWSLVIGLLLVPGVLVLVPLFLRVRELGLFNTYAGIILPQVAGSLPFAIFLFRNFFGQLPEALFGAAEIDGASDWQVLRHVVLPLSKPIVSTVGVLVLLSSWNNYVWPLVVTRDEALRTIPLGLVFLFTDLNLSNFPNPGLEMAAYAMGAAPIIVIFFLATRTFLQGISSGAIKD